MNKNERRSFRRGAVVQIGASVAAQLDGSISNSDAASAIIALAELLTERLDKLEAVEDGNEAATKRQGNAKAADAKAGVEQVDPH